MIEEAEPPSADTVFKDEVVGAVLLPDVVDHADGRMLERRNRLRFAFEACLQLGIG